MRIKPGSQAAIKLLAQEVVTATRKEPGCISYRFLQDAFDDCEVSFVEEWQDRDSITAHVLTPHYLTFREQNASLIVERIVTFYNSQVCD
jgi:quinol monooxygenase YgiN